MVASMELAKQEGTDLVELCIGSLSFSNISEIEQLLKHRLLPSIVSFRICAFVKLRELVRSDSNFTLQWLVSVRGTPQICAFVKLRELVRSDSNFTLQWLVSPSAAIKTCLFDLLGHKDYVRCGGDMFASGSYDHKVVIL
ncbi:unnamed protein product [Fraxinus pennsylvanica]|uniref:Uncharacterized protein n=1 Tax=Fraxinus pennsylvanica TaxID=56036 RepID=A0AAD2A029_9LAMI|nr:unnamed protein product [Fraxinus pennsylvanica]